MTMNTTMEILTYQGYLTYQSDNNLAPSITHDYKNLFNNQSWHIRQRSHILIPEQDNGKPDLTKINCQQDDKKDADTTLLQYRRHSWHSNIEDAHYMTTQTPRQEENNQQEV